MMSVYQIAVLILLVLIVLGVLFGVRINLS